MVDEPARKMPFRYCAVLKKNTKHTTKVRIKDEAIIAAVELEPALYKRYLCPTRPLTWWTELPQTEGCDKPMPIELDEVERRIMQLGDWTRLGKNGRRTCQSGRAEQGNCRVGDQRTALRAKWQSEKELIEGVQK